MAKSYYDILSEYKAAGQDNPFFGKMSLQDYSAMMNKAMPGAYDAGMGPDNFMRRAEAGVDTALEATGAKDFGRYVGGAVGDVFGEKEMGEEAGAKGSRQALTFGSMLLGPPGKFIAPLLAASETYGETGSKGQAALSAGLQALLPSAAAIGRKTILGAAEPFLAKTAATTLGDVAVSRAGATIAERSLGFLGENAGMIALNKIPAAAQNIVHGESLTDPETGAFGTRSLIGDVVGFLPALPLTGHSLMAPNRQFRSQAEITRAQGNYERLTGNKINPTTEEDFQKLALYKYDSPEAAQAHVDTAVGRAVMRDTIMGQPLALGYTPPEQRGIPELGGSHAFYDPARDPAMARYNPDEASILPPIAAIEPKAQTLRGGPISGQAATDMIAQREAAREQQRQDTLAQALALKPITDTLKAATADVQTKGPNPENVSTLAQAVAAHPETAGRVVVTDATLRAATERGVQAGRSPRDAATDAINQLAHKADRLVSEPPIEAAVVAPKKAAPVAGAAREDLSKLTPEQAQKLVTLKNKVIASSKEFDQYSDAIEPHLDDAFVRAQGKGMSDAATYNAMRKVALSKRAEALRQGGEREAYVEGRQHESSQTPQADQEGALTRRTDVDPQVAVRRAVEEQMQTHADESEEGSAIAAEGPRDAMRVVRDRLANAGDLETFRGRPDGAVEQRRAKLLVDYLMTNPEQIPLGRGKDSLDRKAIAELWVREGVGLSAGKDASYISRFADLRKGTLGKVLREIVQREGGRAAALTDLTNPTDLMLALRRMTSTAPLAVDNPVRNPNEPTYNTFGVTATATMQRVADGLVASGRYSPSEGVAYAKFAQRLIALVEPILSRSGVRVGSLTDDTLSQHLGRFVELGGKSADIIAIGRRELSNEGLTDFLFRTVFLHEGLHGIVKMGKLGELEPRAQVSYERAATYIEAMPVNERQDMMTAVLRDMLTGTKMQRTDAASFDGLIRYSAASGEETMATLYGLMMQRLVAVEPKGRTGLFQELMTYLPPALSDFTTRIFQRLNGIVQAFKSSLGLTSRADEMLAKARMLEKEFRNLVAPPEAVEASVRRLTALKDTAEYWREADRQWAPDFRTSELDAAGGGAPASTEPVRSRDGERRWFVEKLASPFFTEAAYKPQLMNAYGTITDIKRMVNTARALLMSPLADRYPDGSVHPNAMKGFVDAAADPIVNRSVRDVALAEQERGTPFTSAEVEALVRKNGGKDTQVQQANKVVPGLREMFRNAGAWMIEDNLAAASMLPAILLQKRGGMSAVDAQNAAREFTRTVFAGDQAGTAAQVAKLQLTPAELKVFADNAAAMQPLHTALTTTLTNPVYWHEGRNAPYFVRYTEGGKSGLREARTEAEAKTLAGQLSGQANIADVSYGEARQYRKNVSDHELPSEVLTVLRETEVKTAALVDSLLPGDPRAEEIKAAMSSSSVLASQQREARLAPFLRPKQGAPGREFLDFMDNGVRYVGNVANTVAKRAAMRQLEIMRHDPELVANPDYAARGEQAAINQLTPDSPFVQKVQNTVSNMTLMGNLSSVFVNLADTLARLPSVLTSRGTGLVESYKRLAQGYAGIPEYVKYARDSRYQGKYSNLFEWARSNGLVGQGVFDPSFSGEDVALINSRRYINGETKALTPAEMLAKPAAWYTHMTRAVFGASEVVNQITALVGAYEASRSRNPSAPESAHFSEAGQVARLVAPTGFRGNRPDLLSKLPAAGALLTLSNYTLQVTDLTARMVSAGLKGSAPDARKAALQMLGTQVAMAGLLGVPGVSVAVAGLDTRFPDLQLKNGLRKQIAKLGGDDKELGQVFSDLALKGAPSAFGPVDLSGRLGVGGVLGLDERKGFDPTRLLGPMYGIAHSWGEALGLTAAGQYSQAFDATAPAGLRNLVRTVREGDMALDRDQHGVARLGAMDQVLRGIGFQPKVYADTLDAKNAVRTANKSYDDAVARFVDEQSQALLRGDRSGVQAAVRDWVSKDTTMLPKDLMNKVVEQAMARTTPYDPMREARRAGDVAGTYALPLGASEQARGMAHMQLQQMAGVPPTLSPQNTLLDLMNPGSKFAKELALRRMQGAGVPQF